MKQTIIQAIYIAVLGVIIFVLGIIIGIITAGAEPKALLNENLEMYEGLTMTHDDALAMCHNAGLIYKYEAEGTSILDLCEKP